LGGTRWGRRAPAHRAPLHRPGSRRQPPVSGRSPSPSSRARSARVPLSISDEHARTERQPLSPARRFSSPFTRCVARVSSRCRADCVDRRERERRCTQRRAPASSRMARRSVSFAAPRRRHPVGDIGPLFPDPRCPGGTRPAGDVGGATQGPRPDMGGWLRAEPRLRRVPPHFGAIRRVKDPRSTPSAARTLNRYSSFCRITARMS